MVNVPSEKRTVSAPPVVVDQTGIFPTRSAKLSCRESFAQLSRIASGSTAERNPGDVEEDEP